MGRKRTTAAPADDELVFNGVDAVTGGYLLPPMRPKAVADLAKGIPPADGSHLKELKWWNQHSTQANFGPSQGLDPVKLEEVGWGVIFAGGGGHEPILDALRPLLQLRRRQAGKTKEKYYQEYTGGRGYRSDKARGEFESKQDFLARHGAGPGPADPENVPYYLMIVADPDTVPFSFQYQLDVQYAVGRLWFGRPDGSPDLAAFHAYARAAAESQDETKTTVALPRKMVLFGTRNPDDKSTRLSADELVAPLAKELAASKEAAAGWDVTTVLAEQATKPALAKLLGGADTPSLLFTASHGLGFPNGDERQLDEQGALVCQEWPGPLADTDGMTPDQYFSCQDVDDSANLLGMIAFHFACYGAGTPRLDDFAHNRLTETRETIAPHPFVAGLPRRLLGHPRGGALAVVGHVERAWGYSFLWNRAGRQLQTFTSTLRELLSGKPVGCATEYLNQRYAELSSDLSVELEEIRWGKQTDDLALAGMWTANNDARSFVILGDPAVRLPLAADAGKPRPTLEPIVMSPSPSPPSPPPHAPPPAAPPTPAADPAPAWGVSNPSPASASAVLAGGEVTFTIPLQVTIRFGPPVAATAAPVTAPAAGGEVSFAAAVAAGISIDQNYGTREGYDPDFLGTGKQRVPLPALSKDQEAAAARLLDPEAGASPFELKYHHYSVILNGRRKLAFFTAVNIDGQLHKKDQLPRGESRDKWFYDPRVDRAAQLGEDDKFYGKPFDRGHLVRRLDPAWGRTLRVARVANDDTFHWSNCSPQHMTFNERVKFWAGLENFLLDKATDERQRLTVFSGPVFSTADREYEGVKIPSRFWKVAVVARPNGRLATLGFIASQQAFLEDVFDARAVAEEYQVSVAKVAKLTGLDFGPLADVDAGSVAAFPADGQKPLTAESDIVIPR